MRMKLSDVKISDVSFKHAKYQTHRTACHGDESAYRIYFVYLGEFSWIQKIELQTSIG